MNRLVSVELAAATGSAVIGIVGFLTNQPALELLGLFGAVFGLGFLVARALLDQSH